MSWLWWPAAGLSCLGGLLFWGGSVLEQEAMHRDAAIILALALAAALLAG
jgi:hypothetical protein